MKNNTKICLIILSLLVVNATNIFAWGTWGHQHINRAALLLLPQELGVFFYDHADFLTEESVVPDLRKYTLNDKAENPRHYIDLEAYNYTTVAIMPQTMKEAIAMYNKDTIQKYGSLPWYIQDMMDKLTTAFREKRKTEILFLAGDLGHYLADAHMPLHTSLNHDGQLTNQRGIHAFWESMLPELFGDNYNLYIGEPHYIDNIGKATWAVIQHSHVLADTLLLIEKQLRETFPKDKMYLKDAKGEIVKSKFNQQVYSKEYAEQYHQRLNGMVEKQMRGAISVIADFWYTAWVNAGKPDLSNLDPKSVTKGNAKNYKKEQKLLKKGRVGCFLTEEEFRELVSNSK